jgi:hypothetical protein
MRLCAFLEAWVQLVLEEGTGVSPERVPQKGVTGLITHHKVAVARSQPWRDGQSKRFNGQGIAEARGLEQIMPLC